MAFDAGMAKAVCAELRERFLGARWKRFISRRAMRSCFFAGGAARDAGF